MSRYQRHDQGKLLIPVSGDNDIKLKARGFWPNENIYHVGYGPQAATLTRINWTTKYSGGGDVRLMAVEFLFEGFDVLEEGDLVDLLEQGDSSGLTEYLRDAQVRRRAEVDPTEL